MKKLLQYKKVRGQVGERQQQHKQETAGKPQFGSVQRLELKFQDFPTPERGILFPTISQ